jgi:myotubularin-related protein 9
MELKVFARTTSLWSHLNRPDVMKSLLNPIYEPNPSVIWPSVAPVSIVLWVELYCRFVIDQNQTKRTFLRIQSMINSQKELRSQVIKLRKQLLDLHKEYQETQIGHSKGNPHSFSPPMMNDSSAEN